MEPLQTAAGLMCVVLGTMHFLDRDRMGPRVRSFYLGSPATSAGRAALALLETATGFALLFTA